MSISRNGLKSNRGAGDAAHDATSNCAHLVAQDVLIEYPRPGSDEVTVAVQNCDLTLERGDFVVLVGPSGCGKTTLLNAVAGFVPIATGVLELDGRPIPG